MALRDLPTGSRLYLDTNIWIYAIEGFTETRASLQTLFARIDAGEITGRMPRAIHRRQIQPVEIIDSSG